LADPYSGWFDPNYAKDYPNAGGWSEPVLGPDGAIYVSFDDPYLRVVEPNGSIRWVTRLNSNGGFTLITGSDGLVYAASDDGQLYVVDANGMGIARFQSDAWLSFPVILADDKVIVSDAKDNSLLITNKKKGIWIITRYGCEDLNIDGNVNFIDLAVLAADWLECTDTSWPCDYVGDKVYLTTDIDRDKYVLFSDLAVLANRWLDNVDWLLHLPPCQASRPYPPDGATDVWPIKLSWFACPDATSHDVYLGTTNPPPFIQNQTDTTFDTGIMNTKTWYYWRIDEVKSTGTTTGTVWTFQTSIR